MVGIIGTGATAVQAIPELAKVVKELYVFQRTPSTIDVRDQRETTARGAPDLGSASRAGPGPGGPVSPRSPRGARPLQANDDYLSGKVADFKERKVYEREFTPEELMEKQLNTNFRIMEQIRARVDAIVEDPKTAAALKPYYPYGCKRPTFHDEYLPTFNLPHVHLVDTAPTGVTRINERGVVHDGVEYPLDVLIYATGFQWMATSTFNMIKGRGGRTLSEKWQSEGTRTFLGLHSHGFPNLFIMTGPQGGGGILQLHRHHRRPRQLRGVDAVDLAGPGRARSSMSRRSRRTPTPSTAGRPTSPPPRCGTACPTTTATARPPPAAWPTTGGATGRNCSPRPRTPWPPTCSAGPPPDPRLPTMVREMQAR